VIHIEEFQSVPPRRQRLLDHGTGLELEYP
jgi:hypothetical protein